MKKNVEEWRIILPTLTKNKKSAEQRLRDAFERLKYGAAETLPKGSIVSQNNVAREAGCDPSALRKTRYPLLVLEIQEWVEANKTHSKPSHRQTILKKRQKSRNAKKIAADLKKQRDKAVGGLIYANRRILELSEMVNDLRSKLDALQPTGKILHFSNTKVDH